MVILIRKLLVVVVLLTLSTQAYSFVELKIGPKEAVINGSIKYSVIGKYKAQFSQYSGAIGLDDKTNEIQSVYLSIDAASIQSDCSWCDKIVRSKQLLSVEEYPLIVFRSNKIMKEADAYWVKGILSLHGEKKEISFPFNVMRIEDSANGTIILNIKGQWDINRKDFKITWNKLLDKGGIVVGNNVIVDWKINVPTIK